MSDFGHSYALESWSLYSVGVLIILLRFVARTRRFGITGLKLDDYVMLNCTVWYTILCVAFNSIASGGGSNLMTQEEIDGLTEESIAHRITGSKWVFASEHCMLMTILSTKLCMLIIYASITDGAKQRSWVNYVGIYNLIAWAASELALFLFCRPLREYWAVPTAVEQCSTYSHALILNACMSIPGDIAILLIGIPILAKLHMPLQQKLILLGIFGMGFFIVIAAILTKVYSLVPSLLSLVYMRWYFREASVAVYVSNLPTIWPLVREVFPGLARLGTTKPVSSGSRDASRWGASIGRSRLASNNDTYDLKSFHKAGSTESQERINDTDVDESGHAAGIKRDVTFTVRTEQVSEWESGHRNWDKQKVTTVVNGVS